MTFLNPNDLTPWDDTGYNRINLGINGQKRIHNGTDYQHTPRGGTKAAAGSHHQSIRWGRVELLLEQHFALFNIF